MTPCEEIILTTVRQMAGASGEAVNIRAVARQAFVSERHTRRCFRICPDLVQEIVRFVEPGKPARLVIKSKETV